MVRRVSSDSNCPPLIMEKWSNAKNNRDAKNEVFGLYLACGGNVGKMNVVEEVVRIDRLEHLKADGWFTRDDLLKKYHGKADKVDELIQRKKKTQIAAWSILTFQVTRT